MNVSAGCRRDALLNVVIGRGEARAPKRQAHRWLRYEATPPDCLRLLINVAAEDTVAALRYAGDLVQRLARREVVSLDFRNMKICTQSSTHALLFEPIRIAWALKTPVYVENASPAVRSQLRFLENYALGG